MTRDFYPTIDSQLMLWHNTFSLECASYAGSFPDVLTPEVLAQVATNSEMVTLVVVQMNELKAHLGGWAAFKTSILRGENDMEAPTPPSALPDIAIPTGAMKGVADYTRALVRRIKAHPNYNASVGAALGVLPPTRGHRVPGVKPTPEPGSKVRLDIGKNGYLVVAIESRRGGGGWETVGLATHTPFIDERPPLVDGQPEVREYRVMGYDNNHVDGDPSQIRVAVTIP
jgi:hypothetical protein